MAVYKDGDKWRVLYRYTDWTGKRKQTQKRGFKTKREAKQWEQEEILKSESKLDMTFASFFEVYEVDKKNRVKENTWESKAHIIRTKILPYFGDRRISEIEPKDILAWQGKLLDYRGEHGERYSPTYLKTIHSQLTSKVKGGYITVKKNGDVIANYAMESDAFKNYLFQHCYMDYPSTDAGHGDYGKVYMKGNQYFFNLNFQVRIC